MGFLTKLFLLGFIVLFPELLFAGKRFSGDDYLTGSWGGMRDVLYQDGVDVGLD